MQDVITIALAKGRLAEKAIAVLEKCGIDCSQVKDPGRRLVLRDETGAYQFILVKPSDVPTYVDSGVADIGIAGGKDGGALFKKGEKPRTVRGDLAEILLDEIHKMLN